jgi:hypothetical protein
MDEFDGVIEAEAAEQPDDTDPRDAEVAAEAGDPATVRLRPEGVST